MVFIEGGGDGNKRREKFLSWMIHILRLNFYNIVRIQINSSVVLLVWKENPNLGSLYEIVEYICDTFDSILQYTILFSLETFTFLHYTSISIRRETLAFYFTFS